LSCRHFHADIICRAIRHIDYVFRHAFAMITPADLRHAEAAAMQPPRVATPLSLRRRAAEAALQTPRRRFFQMPDAFRCHYAYLAATVQPFYAAFTLLRRLFSALPSPPLLIDAVRDMAIRCHAAQSAR
jgi:hypothetical protein